MIEVRVLGPEPAAISPRLPSVEPNINRPGPFIVTDWELSPAAAQATRKGHAACQGYNFAETLERRKIPMPPA